MAEDEEGMSTPKKVATGAAVGLATAAAVGVGKKLLGSDDEAIKTRFSNRAQYSSTFSVPCTFVSSVWPGCSTISRTPTAAARW